MQKKIICINSKRLTVVADTRYETKAHKEIKITHHIIMREKKSHPELASLLLTQGHTDYQLMSMVAWNATPKSRSNKTNTKCQDPRQKDREVLAAASVSSREACAMNPDSTNSDRTQRQFLGAVNNDKSGRASYSLTNRKSAKTDCHRQSASHGHVLMRETRLINAFLIIKGSPF